MNTLLGSFDISVTQVTESKQEESYEFTSNFFDGQSDAENNFEPVTYQWLNSDYRQGYLLGMAKRIGIECKLIYGVEMEKAIWI